MSNQEAQPDLGAELARDQAGAFPRRDEPAEVTVSGGLRLKPITGKAG